MRLLEMASEPIPRACLMPDMRSTDFFTSISLPDARLSLAPLIDIARISAGVP
ncbi:MAG: hypothetical protein BWY66_02908 [bacterium ADurb.Bin374]|nr:MAG: hypothetical protein BWY66_02908 [bacterium ADurb.Bin374]